MIKLNYAKQHYCSFVFFRNSTIPNTLPAQQKPTITERADTQWRSGCNTFIVKYSCTAASSVLLQALAL